MQFRQGSKPPEEFRDSQSGTSHDVRRLDELGSQLHREARRLAARYPAARPQIIVPAAANSSLYRTMTYATLAIAAVVIAAFSPILSDRWAPRGESDRMVSRSSTPGIRTEILDAPSEATAPSPAILASTPRSSGGASLDSTAEIDAHSFLLQVSDPELEALLDLWEEERSEPTRLSI